MHRPTGQTTALLAAFLLTLAATGDPDSREFSGDVPIGERLRNIRDKVSAMQTTPMGKTTKFVGCISGYWRNC